MQRLGKLCDRVSGNASLFEMLRFGFCTITSSSHCHTEIQHEEFSWKWLEFQKYLGKFVKWQKMWHFNLYQDGCELAFVKQTSRLLTKGRPQRGHP